MSKNYRTPNNCRATCPLKHVNINFLFNHPCINLTPIFTENLNLRFDFANRTYEISTSRVSLCDRKKFISKKPLSFFIFPSGQLGPGKKRMQISRHAAAEHWELWGEQCRPRGNRQVLLFIILKIVKMWIMTLFVVGCSFDARWVVLDGGNRPGPRGKPGPLDTPSDPSLTGTLMSLVTLTVGNIASICGAKMETTIFGTTPTAVICTSTFVNPDIVRWARELNFGKNIPSSTNIKFIAWKLI